MRGTSSQEYIVVQVLAKGAGLITVIIGARGTSPEVIGRYTIALLGASLVAVVLDGGSSRSTLRLASEGRERAFIAGTILRRNWLMRVALILGLVWSQISSGSRLIGLSMALAGLLAINAVAEAVLLGEQRGGLAGLGNGVFNCVALLSTGLMVILDRGRVDATELLLAYFLGAMSAQACYVIGDANQRRTDRRRAMAFHWTRGQGKAIHQGELHYSWVAFVLMLVAFGYYRADILVLAVIASSRQVGEYAVAYRVFEVTLVLLQLLSLAAQPGMVRASYDGAEASHIRQVSAGLLVSGGVCACLLVLVGPVLLRFAFGAQYVSAAGLIPLFALGAVGQAISLASNGLLLGSLDATRKSVSLVLLNAVCVLLGAAGVVVGYEMGALRGVAFLQALTEISVGLLLCLVIFGRRSIPVGRMLMGWAAFAGGGAATVFLAPGIVSRLAAGVVLSGIAGWAVWRRAELVSWIHSW